MSEKATSGQKAGKGLRAITFDASIPTELSADHILPDTYPDVKKILRVDVRPILLGRFISGKKLEYNGAVDYVILFSADGESGKEELYTVHFAGDFKSEPGDLDGLEGGEVTLETRLDSCHVKLLNPRKFSIRTLLMTDVCVTHEQPALPRFDGLSNQAEAQTVEKLTKKIPSVIEKHLVADGKQFSENIELDPALPPIDEVITCDGRVRFAEAKPNDSDSALSVSLKGELLIDCLYRAQTETNGYHSVSKKLPVTAVIDLPELAPAFRDLPIPSLAALAGATLTELNASVGEDAYGERRVLETDMTFDISLTLFGESETEIVTDAYSTVRETVCEKKVCDCRFPGRVTNTNFSASEAFSRDALGIPEDAALLDTKASAKMKEVTLTGGRAVLTGEAALCFLFADGEGHFLPAERVIPLRCEIPAGDLREPLSMTATATVSDLRTRADAERVSVDFETAVQIALIPHEEIETVEKISFGAPKNEEKRPFTVLCYPLPTDTPWTVAKRYNVTVGKLKEWNPMLSEDSVPSVLMIP